MTVVVAILGPGIIFDFWLLVKKSLKIKQIARNGQP